MSASPSLDPTDRAIELLRSLEAQKTDEPQVAEPMDRAASRLLDLGMFLVLFLVVGLSAGGIIWLFDPPAEGATVADGPLATAVSLGATAILLLAMAANELAAGITGQTLGKKLYSLQVVDAETGRPIGIRRAAARSAMWLAPAVTFAALSAATFPGTLSLLFFAVACVFLAAPLWMFADRGHRGLHDILTHTVVRSPR
jgi:uncharacterized RDD family membrane protein YckC